MIHAQNTKEVILVAPQSIADGTSTASVTGSADCAGYDYAVVRVAMAPAATTESMTALKLSENDDAGTAWTDITAFTGGTATGNFTLPTATGTDATGEIYKFYVDLRKRKRYLQVTLHPDAVRVGAAMLELYRAEQAPDTAAERGLDLQVIG